jgi:hypothetical protein
MPWLATAGEDAADDALGYRGRRGEIKTGLAGASGMLLDDTLFTRLAGDRLAPRWPPEKAGCMGINAAGGG